MCVWVHDLAKRFEWKTAIIIREYIRECSFYTVSLFGVPILTVLCVWIVWIFVALFL